METGLVKVARDLLMERIAAADESVWLASPYMSHPIAKRIADSAGESGAQELRLLTCVDPRSIQSRFLHPSALSALLDAGFEIRSIGNLHAKVSIVDRSWGLVGSGNLTESGLGNPSTGNVELGVLLRAAQVKEATGIAEAWWSEAKRVSAAQINEYAKLKPLPPPPLPPLGPEIATPDLGRLEEILAEDATTASSRSYWIDPNFHNPDDEAWWKRGWISDPERTTYAPGDLIFIYLGAESGGPQLCPAVGRALTTSRYDPEFVLAERDDEAAERWPWVTEIAVVAEAPAFSGAPLAAAGKTYHSIQGHCSLTREEFEGIARELIARNS